MEQNGHKFRIRLNLFDAIVLVVVLLAGAAFAWLSLRSGQERQRDAQLSDDSLYGGISEDGPG